MLEVIGGRWMVLERGGCVGGCRRVLKGVGRCRRVFEGVGGCWRVPKPSISGAPPLL